MIEAEQDATVSSFKMGGGQIAVTIGDHKVVMSRRVAAMLVDVLARTINIADPGEWSLDTVLENVQRRIPRGSTITIINPID